MDKYEKTITQLVKQIIKISKPLKIILFGSVAKGKIHKDSDIDILVIMPNGTNKRKTAQELYSKIEHIQISFDIIVATPETLEKNKDNNGLIYKSALKEGKEIYAA